MDQHIYARENGWFIEALTELYAVTSDARYRDEAVQAAKWIIDHRAIKGGFRHDEKMSGPLTLGDTLAMARAFLGLYGITGDRAWLDHAENAAAFIRAHFAFSDPGRGVTGFATAENATDATHYMNQPDFDENVSLARFANLLAHDTGNKDDHVLAQTALNFASVPAIAQARLSSVGGLLLAEQELTNDPLHIAIVGKRDDVTAQKLFAAALAYPVLYKQVEWIDPHQKDSLYPDLPQTAAYTCANQSCSAPVFDVEHCIALLDRKTAPKK